MKNENKIPLTKKYSNGSEWFERLEFSDPEIVFTKGAPGTWDEFGVRDPALLVDEDGYLVFENGCMVMYYTGSTDRGETQAIGRAVSRDNGKTWKRVPETPVLAKDEKDWDAAGVSTPWVVKSRNGQYRLYYRGYKKIYSLEAIGLATSQNGVDFERRKSGPILVPEDFSGLDSKRMILMAVTNIVRMFDGRDLLTFEGFDYSGKCQIYAAVSADKEHFVSFNQGSPIFTSDHVETWPVRNVANPRIVAIEESNLYMLTFNGSRLAEYSLGQAFSRDLKTWNEQAGNPILCPTGTPIRHPFSGRIEGGVIPKEDLVGSPKDVRMFFMAIPAFAYSHENAAIGLCAGTLKGDRYNTFSSICANKEEVSVIEDTDEGGGETLVVRKALDSQFPPRAVFFANAEGEFQGIGFEFRLKKTGQNKEAWITVGQGLDAATNKDGSKLRFLNGSVYFKVQSEERNYLQRGFNKLLKLLFGVCDWGLWFFWHKVAAISLDGWHHFALKKVDGSYYIFLNQERIGPALLCENPLRISLSVQSNGLQVDVRSMEKL